MRVLIIHHLEEIWSYGYQNHGTSFEREAEKILDHLDDNPYDLVILTLFEDWNFQDCHHLTGISQYVDRVYTYAYGWTIDETKRTCGDVEWVEGGYHSDFVPIFNWIRDLKGHEVHLCGAFDGECIEDMEHSLKGADIEFTRIAELIV